MKKLQGFTLIETAMVLVIVALLLGGVLQGNELIQSARIHNQIAFQDAARIAFLAFQDRYRALPGDFSAATHCIAGATVDGDGNGRIEYRNWAGTREDIAAWEHLSHAGFTAQLYTYGAATGTASTPTSYYGVPLQLVYDDAYGDPGVQMPPRHGLKTGNQMPAAVLAAIDAKTDDGNALSGNFRFSAYAPDGNAPNAASCFALTTGRWNPRATNDPNCGGVSLY